MFSHISVSFANSGLKFCRHAKLGWFVQKKYQLPGGGHTTKEPMWTFEVDYVTRNNKSAYFLCNQHQTSISVPSYGTTVRETGSCT